MSAASSGRGHPSYAAVPLSKYHGRSSFARVDIADIDLVERFGPWSLDEDATTRYARTTVRAAGHRIHLFMHYLLLGPAPAPGLRIQHRNGNGLDNTRANIRYATQKQILAGRKPGGGSSRFKGVGWDDEQRKWMATFRGRKVGRFKDEVEAAQAFDRAAFAYWGEDAYLNFPDLLIPPEAS